MDTVNPFDCYALAYDEWFDSEGKIIFETEVRAFRELANMLPKPWIEIGVGTGRFAEALGIRTGLDSSAKMLEIAGRRGIETYSGQAERLPFDSSSFGTAFLIVTLCFLPAPVAALKETHRILIPGGKIVVGVVLRSSPWGRLYYKKKQGGHHLYKDATFYSYEELSSMLLTCGFIIEKVISTLFQKPDKIKNIELPRTGFSPEAGFTIIVAGKTSSDIQSPAG